MVVQLGVIFLATFVETMLPDLDYFPFLLSSLNDPY